MTQAKVIWPPYPYQAGFCITDDPDASTLKQTRAVYDFLMLRSFKTTKAVWAFKPEEKCGIPAVPDSALRGITLEDKQYIEYCKKLKQHGYDLCLHGASAGNNRRERTEKAFASLAEHFGGSDTYICHSKNADNIYWEEKTTSLVPFNYLLHFYSRNSCSGENPQSPYFWGDLCYSNINQIRLYKTRRRNTLKRNPSMPYYDPRKPFVNGWFTATKRSLADCATEAALAGLKGENGLTVLYQYLHRYADPGNASLDQQFVEAIDRIASDPNILVDTVSSIMKRLRQVQSIFVAFRGTSFWLINVADEDISALQIVSDSTLTVPEHSNDIETTGRTLIIRNLPRHSIRHIVTSQQIRFTDKNTVHAGKSKRVYFQLPCGELRVDLNNKPPHEPDRQFISRDAIQLRARTGGTGKPILSQLSRREELILILDQLTLIAREVLLKGRRLDVNAYLDDSRQIPLEDHYYW